MVEFVDEADYSSKLAQEVQQELPTIYVSVKNMIAYAMGKSYDATAPQRIQPQNVMTCAKYLLEAIRTRPLPDVEQFCAEHPQPEDQLGVNRLEDICKYKVIYALRYKAEEKGGRITRLFGKSYIRWTKLWDVFRRDTEKLLVENTHIPLEEIEYFLQTYEASLKEDDARERSSTVSTEDLIWANDFNSVLSCMVKERQQRVDERSRASTVEHQGLEQQLFNVSPAQSLSSTELSSGLDALHIRSRAATMEQLGLETPCFDASPSMAFLRAASQSVDRQQSPPLPDRSRATTLDLFAYEMQQQQSLVQGPDGVWYVPTPAELAATTMETAAPRSPSHR